MLTSAEVITNSTTELAGGAVINVTQEVVGSNPFRERLICFYFHYRDSENTEYAVLINLLLKGQEMPSLNLLSPTQLTSSLRLNTIMIQILAFAEWLSCLTFVNYQLALLFANNFY